MNDQPRKEPTETAKSIASEQIRAQAAEWAALTPEQRVEHIRAEQLRRAEEEAKQDRISQGQLDSILSAFSEMAKTAKVMTKDQEADYRWEKRTKPTLEALGVKDRHMQRISEWNNDLQEMAFEDTKELCRNRGAIVLLAGARGAGKTFLCTQIMRERVEDWQTWNDTMPELRKGPIPYDPGRYEKLGRLGAMFKPLYADFGSIANERLNGLFETWCTIPFLILDEIHESEDLKTQMRFLTDLCDRRYAQGFDTVLISNRSGKDCADLLSPSIISRISEAGRIIHCEWESWRSKIAKLNVQ